MYQHPGVYIRDIPSRELSVEAVSSSIAAFLGHVKRGKRVTDKRGKRAAQRLSRYRHYHTAGQGLEK